MTDREAIDILKYERGMFPPYFDRDVEVFDVAISALQEREEREEPCIMCSGFGSNRQWLVSQGNGMYVEYTYQYCPMCGRKLGDEE